MTRRLTNPARREKLRSEIYANVPKAGPSPGAVIKDLRRMLGLTRAEYARRAHVSEESLRRVEQGRANATLETLEKLLNIGGLTVSVRQLSNHELIERQKMQPVHNETTDFDEIEEELFGRKK